MRFSKQPLALGVFALSLSVFSTAECQQPATTKNTASAQQPKPSVAQKYRVVTKQDGLSCSFSQDLAMSLGSPSSGSVSATANHFICLDKTKKEVEIELISKDPSVNVIAKDGKIEIRTKKFGSVYRGNEVGKLDVYEMTDTQIKQLKAFLGL